MKRGLESVGDVDVRGGPSSSSVRIERALSSATAMGSTKAL